MRSARYGLGVERTFRQLGFSIFAACILLLSALPAHSVPLPPLPPVPPVPTCKTDTLANYIALTNGCTLGGFTFSDFTYTFPGGIPAANQITLTPADTFTGAPDGFTFAADPTFSFQGMGPALYDVGYFVFGNALEAAAVTGGSGILENGGTDSVDENLCVGGIFDATGVCFVGTYDFIQATPGTNDRTFFDPTTIIDVQTELSLDGTQANSSVSTSGFEEQFALAVPQAPEPPSLILLLIALAATPSLLKRSRLNHGEGR
jgi:hypothetical protein